MDKPQVIFHNSLPASVKVEGVKGEYTSYLEEVPEVRGKGATAREAINNLSEVVLFTLWAEKRRWGR